VSPVLMFSRKISVPVPVPPNDCAKFTTTSTAEP
jgi:hypothetical protein